MTRFRPQFGAPWSPLPDPHASLSIGHRRLAARVIYQAFRDLESPGVTAEQRLSARVFLAGSTALEYWCELAQTDSARVVARAQSQVPLPRARLVATSRMAVSDREDG